jgi:nucleotide-binding universal stress UspA family protein
MRIPGCAQLYVNAAAATIGFGLARTCIIQGSVALAHVAHRDATQTGGLPMKADKILFATDLSDASHHALALATSLARDTGATLIIAHVEEPPMAYGGGEMYYAVEEPDREQLRKALCEVMPADESVPVVHKLLVGDPAEAIVELAKTDHVDMIVLGTHGRTGLTRLLMGSVAEAVVRRAECPVLTVKQPAAVAAH